MPQEGDVCRGVIMYDIEDRRSGQELIHLGESKSKSIFGR